MSSILDALKKAEKESTADRGAGTPWPAPLSAPSSYRRRTRRWWMPLGIVVGLCISGVYFWQARRPEITRPGESMTVVPKPNRPHDSPSPSFGEKKQMRPPTIMHDDSPNKAIGNAPVAVVQETATMTKAPVRPPETKPPPAAAPVSGPKVIPSPPPSAHAQRPAAVSGQPVTDALETGIVFRNDPRIDLQALVWAPETTGRFVVINNRLIKEGGAMDNIIVVRINPDDVLLAEGSERWHEAFTIR